MQTPLWGCSLCVWLCFSRPRCSPARSITAISALITPISVPRCHTCWLLFLWLTPLVSQVKPPFLRVVFPELSLPSSFPPSASPGHIILPDPHSIITTYSLHLHMWFIVSFLDLLLDPTKENSLSVLFIIAYSNYNRVIAPWWERFSAFWLRSSALRGFPGGSVVKNLPANIGDVRDAGLISRSGRSPGEGNGNPLQYSCLENPMDRGAWWQ